MTDPAGFDVRYAINPWMRPADWTADPRWTPAAALAAFASLRRALEDAGAEIEVTAPAPDLPDMVFPANAAVVLDRRALLGRFRPKERRGEEAAFLAAFRALEARGLVDEVAQLPAGTFQEGAGDCIWDAARGHFWAGFGQRSSREAATAIATFFGRTVVALELATPRFYHLDTCFCPLSGGAVLYYPPAFTPAALAEIRARVPARDRIEAEDADAEGLCVNAVCLGRTVIMARAPERLKARLRERGFRVVEVDLAPFILAGGAAFCMTLRLDLSSRAAQPAAPALEESPA